MMMHFISLIAFVVYCLVYSDVGFVGVYAGIVVLLVWYLLVELGGWYCWLLL